MKGFLSVWPRRGRPKNTGFQVLAFFLLSLFSFYRLLIYHCGAELEMRGMGPFFYCSKVEHYLEARLWNSIFSWTETRLGLKKVCVIDTV